MEVEVEVEEEGEVEVEAMGGRLGWRRGDGKDTVEGLGRKVMDASKAVRSLIDSARTLTARFIDYCSSGSAEGRVSTSQVKELVP